jgi:lipid-A-disaccharide synthase-like uncharacterized protein
MSEFLRKLVEQSARPVELLGFVGQFVFFLRFVVQWIASERRKESVIPEPFWWISIVGGGITLIYGIVHKDNAGNPDPIGPVILAQSCANVIYVRNLVLVRRTKRRLAGESARG